MSRQRSQWGLLAVLASLLASAACTDQKSILLVEIYGPTGTQNLGVRQFYATIHAGLDNTAFYLPAELAASDIQLPASFTLTLSQSRTGPVTMSLDAHDVNGDIVGYGSTSMTHIALGGQTIIPVYLMAPPPSGTDGGSDAAPAVDALGQDVSEDAPDAKSGDGRMGLDAAAE
jgi:hypothetical protein